MLLKFHNPKKIIFLFLFVFSCTVKEKKEEDTSSSNTNLDTLRTYYTETNTLKSETPLKNGKRNGLCKWYYPSGIIKTMSYYADGIEIDETIYYYPDGTIENYNFFDLKGNLRFNIVYDSLGRILNHTGKSLYLIRDFIENDSSNRKRVSIKTFVATPPNAEITLEMKDMNNKLTSVYKMTNEGKKYPLFATQCLSTEVCSFMIIANIKDSINNSTIRDTAFYNQIGN